MNYTVQGAAGEPRASTGKLLHRRKKAQEMLDTSNTTFHRLVNEGKLKVVHIGASSYVTDESLRAYVASLMMEAA
ncbi:MULTISPECIES: helix-turn-helix domain-containing protein [unclassified Methylobacterium]|uniref:helix-turn-helix domain-containing protein n=1 Tax=unclassified Methylobacterium TaxID=2615210 RepID=UPI00226AEDFD|nr:MULTISPECIES: helix-turn-helix domain-containing protein [unclassified Methylobacterium]